MAGRLYLTMQIMTAIVWIYNIFNKKFRLHVLNIITVIAGVMTASILNRYEFVNQWGIGIIVYIELFVFCLIEFEFPVFQSVERFIVTVILVFMGQVVAGLPVLIANEYVELNCDVQYLLINIILLISSLILTRIVTIGKLMDKYWNDIKRKIFLGIAFGMVIVLYLIYYIRQYHAMHISMYFIIVVLLVGFYFMYLQGMVTDCQLKKSEQEREVERKYDGAYNNLVDAVRMQQHDFKNHIQAMLSIADSGKDSREICEQQQEYCREVMGMLSDSKVLSNVNSHPLAGFIYDKIRMAKELGIRTESNLRVNQCEVGIPLYEIIEMVGILLDNAYEEVANLEKERQCVEIKLREEEGLQLQIGNPTTLERVEEFFCLMDKGKSTKGKGRGLGLAKIQEYCKQYDLDVLVEIKKRENGNWIYIGLHLENLDK